MKLFIWERVSHATEAYHHEGGIVAIATGIRAARTMIAGECGDRCGALSLPPDYEVETDATEKRLFIFPDAGCC